MHNAPSVSYPVGRCAFQRWVFTVLCMASGALLVAWAWGQPMGWVWAVAVGCWLLATGWGGHACWHHRGTLTWTGQVWCLHGQSGEVADALGNVHVSMDVQGALLLQWMPLSDDEHHGTVWLWLGAENSPKLWQDLRCAVFATVRTA